MQLFVLLLPGFVSTSGRAVKDIQLRNVTAAVMKGSRPAEALPGMTYLSRVEMINRGDRLILRRKY
ncbi:MAG: hypothetical protein ACE5FQ_09265 [Thiogranum sp.]